MFYLFPTFTVYLCAPCTLIPISTLSAYAMFALSPTALTVLRKYNFLSSVLLMFKFFAFLCFVCSSIFNFCLLMLCLLKKIIFIFCLVVLCLLFVWRMLCLFPISYICLLKLCSLLNCQFFPFFLLKLCFSELSVSAFLVQANFLLLFANTLHVTHFSHFVSQCFCCEFF